MIRFFTLLLLSLSFAIGQTETRSDTILEKSKAAEPSSLLESRANLENLNNNTTNGASGTIRTFDNRKRELEGTPYLFSDRRSATAVLVDGQILTGPARLNAYNGTVEFSHNGTEMKILTGQVRALKFDIGNQGRPLNLDQYQLPLGGPQPLPPFLYETIYQGEATLLKRYSKTFKQGSDKTVYHTDKPSDEYINLALYYFKPAGSDTYKPIKLRKKPLLNALGSQATKAKNYIKSQKLDCNKAGDVVQLLAYLEGK